MPRFIFETEFTVAATDPEVQRIAWSPDGTQLATLAPFLRYAKLFAVPSGRELAMVNDFAGGGGGIEFAADRRILIPPHDAAGAALSLWQPESGTITNIPGPDASSARSATNHLFSFSLDASRRRLVGLHRAPRGSGVASSLAVYDAGTWQLRADHHLSGTVVALSADGVRVALNSRGGFCLIADAETGYILQRFQIGQTRAEHLVWDPSGTRVTSGNMAAGYGPIGGTDRYGPLQPLEVLQLWDAMTGHRIAAVPDAHGGGVTAIDVSPDGRWLCTATADMTLRLWDARTLEPLQRIAEGFVARPRFSPDGQRLAVAQTGRGAISVYRLD